jgi:hypothetical protein
MSRKLEVIALQIANRGWNNFFRLPSRGLVARLLLFLHLLWTVLLNSIEAGFNYPISKKYNKHRKRREVDFIAKW